MGANSIHISGFGINVEQEISKNFGVFGRLAGRAAVED